MKAEEIEVGGVYESIKGRQRTVIYFDQDNAPEMTRILYVSGQQDPEMSRSFSWLHSFAKWATKRIDTREESK